jgi:hypothetical protein
MKKKKNRNKIKNTKPQKIRKASIKQKQLAKQVSVDVPRQRQLMKQPAKTAKVSKILWLEFFLKDFKTDNRGLQLAANYPFTSNDNAQIQVIPNKRGYQPKTSGLYPCLPLLPEWKPLFTSYGIKVFAIKVLPLKRETTTINGTEITVLDSRVFVPHWAIKKHETTILFRDGNCCLIWIEDIQKRRTVVQELNRAEKNVSGVKNPWTENKKNEMIEPPPYSVLDKSRITELVIDAFEKPLKEIIQNNNPEVSKGRIKFFLLGSVGT